MKLYFSGHDCRFAVEQMMLTLFPGERPEYPQSMPEAGESAAFVQVTRDQNSLIARTELHRDGCIWTGIREAPLPEEEPEQKRVLQHTLRLSFYDAGTACLGYEPPWGALTGVRPVKLPSRDLRRGLSRQEAEERFRRDYRVSPERAELALDCAEASLNAEKSLEKDQVSLYVGIPFCPSRCAYCSFISMDVKGSARLVEPYLDALCREIQALGEVLRATGKKLRTVYMGGGTPTTLSASQLARLMETLRTETDLSHCTEYTVEAGRPDTITADKLTAIREGGATRVSVNPQTMDDAVLQAIGRAHTASQTRQAWELVKEAGFEVVNMDLIAGLPRDSLAGFRASLDEVLEMGPANITVHTLALKKSAALFQSQERPDGTQAAAMLDYAWSALKERGYVPYYLYRQKYMAGSLENVGWCLPGTENLYNICMMEELHPVLCVGAGGVSKLTDGRGRLKRLCNPKYPADYLAGFDRVLEQKQTMMNVLRSI